MNNNLFISAAGLALQKRYEKGPAACSPSGFAPMVYRCDAGKPTIGWGHVITHSDNYLLTATIDIDGAEVLLRDDNAIFENGIKRFVKVELKQCEFDALVCLAYNIGLANFSASTLLKKLNAGDKIGAAGEFKKWNKYRDPESGDLLVAKGLDARRGDECMLFLGDAPKKGAQ